MPYFSPQFNISRNRNNGHLFNHNETSKCFIFKTYVELKRKMKFIMKTYGVNDICVSRSRRGQWGEWFEYWHLIDDKPIKGREGWM